MCLAVLTVEAPPIVSHDRRTDEDDLVGRPVDALLCHQNSSRRVPDATLVKASGPRWRFASAELISSVNQRAHEVDADPQPAGKEPWPLAPRGRAFLPDTLLSDQEPASPRSLAGRAFWD